MLLHSTVNDLHSTVNDLHSTINDLHSTVNDFTKPPTAPHALQFNLKMVWGHGDDYKVSALRQKKFIYYNAETLTLTPQGPQLIHLDA